MMVPAIPVLMRKNSCMSLMATVPIAAAPTAIKVTMTVILIMLLKSYFNSLFNI